MNNQLSSFYLIWRNLYLKNIILRYIRIYENVEKEQKVFTIESIKKFKNIGYLENFIIDLSTPTLKLDIEYLKSNVFSFCSSIEFKITRVSLDLSEYINLNGNDGNGCGNIKSIKFNSYKLSSVKGLHLITSLTNLEMGNSSFDSDIMVPPNLLILKLPNRFNGPIEKGNLNNKLESIQFPHTFNNIISNDSLPKSLKSIEFLKEYPKSQNGWILDISNLKNLQSIKIGESENLTSCSLLPKSLKSIKFDTFNPDTEKSVEDYSFKICQPNLTSLDFGRMLNGFNDVVLYQLSNTLKTLKITNGFDKKIDSNTLPISLTYIELGNSFDRPLGKGLKHLKNLHTIVFGNSFDKRIRDSPFPVNLKVIKFGLEFNSVIDDNSLPNGLEYLSFDRYYKQQISTGTLPSSLTYLSFGEQFNKPFPPSTLPEKCNLKTLKFGSCFNQPIESTIIGLNKLVKLIVGESFQYPLDSQLLPKSLTKIQCYNALEKLSTLNQKVPFTKIKFFSSSNFNSFNPETKLPPSLKNVIFGKITDNVLLHDTLPIGLKSLSFTSVINLTFGSLDDTKLNFKLPIGLTRLELLRSNYTCDILKSSLPDSLHTIYIGISNPNSFDFENTLKSIIVEKENINFIQYSIDNDFYHKLKIIDKPKRKFGYFYY